jgi:hypothetical protein
MTTVTNSESSTVSQAQETPQSDFALQIAQTAAALGDYLSNWAQQVYAQTSTLTDQVVNTFINYANQAQGLATDQISQYENVTLPQMNELAAMAASYASPSRVAYEMGAAGANAAQAADAANNKTLQTLRGYGIDPSSGMYGDILASQNTAAGAPPAGAPHAPGL